MGTTVAINWLFENLTPPEQSDAARQARMCISSFLNWHHSMEEWATHLSSSAMQTWLNSNLRFALQNSRQIDFSFNISFVLDSQQGKTQLCLRDMSPLNSTWQLKSQGIMSNCFFFSIPAKPWLKNGGNNWGYHIMLDSFFLRVCGTEILPEYFNYLFAFQMRS